MIPVPYKHPLGWVSGGKVVSLTFDDGPSRYTGQVLDVLDRYHVKATFCQIGQQVGSFPAVETRIGADGHTLCNHTWTHDEALPAKSVAVIDAQISRTQTAIRTATGSTPRYYRAPGGDFGTTPKLPGQLARFHTIPLAWAVDSVDWRKPGVAAIVKNVVSAVTPGAIIVMHDGGGDRTQTLGGTAEDHHGTARQGLFLHRAAPQPAALAGADCRSASTAPIPEQRIGALLFRTAAGAANGVGGAPPRIARRSAPRSPWR